MPEYPKESQNLEIKLIDGTILQGSINTAGYTRISDFLDSDPSAHLKVYNVMLASMPNTGKLIIPKSKVLCYKV